MKQFEAVQTGLPLCVLGGLFAPVKLSPRSVTESSCGRQSKKVKKPK